MASDDASSLAPVSRRFVAPRQVTVPTTLWPSGEMSPRSSRRECTVWTSTREFLRWSRAKRPSVSLYQRPFQSHVMPRASLTIAVSSGRWRTSWWPPSSSSTSRTTCSGPMPCARRDSSGTVSSPRAVMTSSCGEMLRSATVLSGLLPTSSVWLWGVSLELEYRWKKAKPSRRTADMLWSLKVYRWDVLDDSGGLDDSLCTRVGDVDASGGFASVRPAVSLLPLM
mmetsp:Transcript_41451/g.117699  ORF Transcript_41451/g.117699 Transcript_41451/m.117699 type:complete len:225 (-) Transcript_41451:417-1091(-)